VEGIELTYNGRLAQLKTDMIRNAAIAGVLRGADGVNRISATAAAQERGIRIHEDKREHVPGGTGATLRLSVHWSRKNGASADQPSQGDWTGLGTVIHGHSPRLLSYDGIDIEAELAGTLLVIRNQDVPGVIGRIGTLLGEAGLNIANFALGRGKDARHAGRALAFVQLDTTDTSADALENAIAALRAVPAITSVRLVEFER
jgi:D-3-phosphoglycerate dehydrogenase